MREKRPQPVHVAGLIAKTAGRMKFKDRMIEYILWDRWDKIFGEPIASHAQPSRWMRGTLVVRVEHPTWIQELNPLKTQMIEKIKKVMPDLFLKGIKFELGEMPPPPPNRKARRLPNPIGHDEIEFIDRAVNEISNPEVKAAARSAMIKGFQMRPIN